jgi:hypothetical protein
MSFFSLRHRKNEENKTSETESPGKPPLKDLCPDEEMYFAAARPLYLNPEEQFPNDSIESLISDAQDALR